MIHITIRKSGQVVTSFTIHDNTYGVTTQHFGDGYVLEAAPGGSYASANTYYVQPNPTDVGMAIDRMTAGLSSASRSIQDAIAVITETLQKDVEYWRGRALALETENQLLRPT